MHIVNIQKFHFLFFLIRIRSQSFNTGNDSSHMCSQSGSSVNGSQGGGGKVDCDSSSMQTDKDSDVKLTKGHTDDVDMEVDEDGMIWETLSDVSEMSDL